MNGIRINIADNGFVMEYDDPAIRENNRKPDTTWQDPCRQRVFNDVAQLTTTLNALLPAMLEQAKKPKEQINDFQSAIAEALSEIDNDD